MILRLRSRDGMERLEVSDGATVGELKQKIGQQLHISVKDLKLSQQQTLLLSQTPEIFTDLSHDDSLLGAAGLQHGSVVFMLYPGEREVESAYKKTPFENGQFGQKMTIEAMIANQIRIERQEQPTVASVSFDIHAANTFQSYVRAAMAFSIKRGGVLYGTVDDNDNIKVDFIYEPPQEGSADSLVMESGTDEEQKVDFIAGILGLQKVGIILSQSSKERDFIGSTGEIKIMASLQNDLGEKCATALVSLDSTEDGGQVHFEAYQCSKQCVELFKDGFFVADQEDHSGVLKVKDPQEPDKKYPVIVAGKDVDEVDNDFFLCPVNILDHKGPLSCSFPVENRLLPQGSPELKAHLQKKSGAAYVELLSDFHVLLFLSKQLDNSDMALLCEAVRDKKPILDGYKVIIDSIANIV